MAGETDLDVLLAGLTASRRPGEFTMVTLPSSSAELSSGVEALIREPEGISAVARIDVARKKGWEPGPLMAWLTLDVHSSLEAVGLTAAVAEAFAELGIACNVVAGFYHDHLLVPVGRAGEAIDAITALGDRG